MTLWPLPMTQPTLPPLSGIPPELPPHPAVSGRWRGWLAASSLVGVSVVSAWSLSNREERASGPQERPAARQEGDDVPASRASPELPVAEPPVRAPRDPAPAPPALRALSDVEAALVGRWESEYHGRMNLEKHPDRTARLVIDCDFLASLLYAPRLILQLEWKVEGDVLTHTIVGGEPTDACARLIRHFGASCSYEIIERSENLVRLRETADPTQIHVWRRTPAEASPTVPDPP